MSATCWSSVLFASATVTPLICGCGFPSAFIVVGPLTRHGLPTPALEKHRCHFFPGLANLLVSTMDGWIISSHGVLGAPCGASRPGLSWRSKAAWLKNFDGGASKTLGEELGHSIAPGDGVCYPAGASA